MAHYTFIYIIFYQLFFFFVKIKDIVSVISCSFTSQKSIYF